MRDILATLVAMVLLPLGAAFLMGVIVGMVAGRLNSAGGGRRGVALPQRRDPKAPPKVDVYVGDALLETLIAKHKGTTH